jgi:hypothetical protein
MIEHHLEMGMGMVMGRVQLQQSAFGVCELGISVLREDRLPLLLVDWEIEIGRRRGKGRGR